MVGQGESTRISGHGADARDGGKGHEPAHFRAVRHGRPDTAGHETYVQRHLDFVKRLKTDRGYRKACGEFYEAELIRQRIGTSENSVRTRILAVGAEISDRTLARFRSGAMPPRTETVEAVCKLLGYSRVSDFAAAFMKWYGAGRGRGRRTKVPPFVKLARHENVKSAYTKEIEDAVQAVRKHSHDVVGHCARQRLIKVMGVLTERFAATSCWLFLKKADGDTAEPWIGSDSMLELKFHHNTGCTTLFRQVRKGGGEGAGIIGHVAATHRPYLTNDVSNDRYYHFQTSGRCPPRPAGSELAVPIVVSDGGRLRLIGVFNLESTNKNAFLECHQGELMAAATELAPEILVLHHLRDPQAFGWHPETHGWTVDSLLEEFCAGVAGHYADPAAPGTAATRDQLPRPSCTVWQREEDGSMWARATARVDYEYIDRRTLSTKSFTSRVAASPPGAVGRSVPRKVFERPAKSIEMGIAYAFSAPVHPMLTKENQPGVPALGTVNVYYFKDELPARLRANPSLLPKEVPDWLIASLAEEVARIVDGCERLRERVAAAVLRFRLHERTLPGLTDFDTIRQVAMECMEAHSCSVFGRDRSAASPAGRPDSRRRGARRRSGVMRCLATTGLQRADGTAVDRAEVHYDLDDARDHGLTARLAAERGSGLRLRSTVDLISNPPRSDAPVAANKYRETYSHADTEHRPFLGVSVDGPAGAASSGMADLPVGVIRVLRASGSRPFTLSDERLLRRLADESAPLFHRWSLSRRGGPYQRSVICGARYPFFIRVARVLTPPKLDAMDQIGAGFLAGARWNRRYVDAVLLDLINLFRNPVWRKKEHGALIVNFRVAPAGRQNAHRIYAIHRLLSSEPPAEPDAKKHEHATRSIGLTTMQRKRPVTFDPHACKDFKSILKESGDVQSGVCVPVRFLSRGGVVWGVLSVDCDDMRIEDWRSEHLEVVALAAKKLDFVGRDNSFDDPDVYRGDTWREALQLFVTSSLQNAGVAACNIVETRVPHRELFRSSGGAASELARLAKTNGIDPTFGYAVDQSGRFVMDLWWGAFPTGLRLVGRLDGKASGPTTGPLRDETFRLKMSEISHLWNRFVSAKVGTGVKPLFKLSFREDDVRRSRAPKGMRLWTPELSLAPDVFGHGPIQLTH